MQYVETFHNLLHALEQTALEYATDMATVALAWVLAQPVDTVLTGARTKDQLYANLHGQTIPLAGSHLVALRQIADNLDDLIPPDEDNVFFHRW
jgi:aryl-alcohol dehydrogenase-like predicted oxidoreductase